MIAARQRRSLQSKSLDTVSDVAVRLSLFQTGDVVHRQQRIVVEENAGEILYSRGATPDLECRPESGRLSASSPLPA